MQDFLKDRLSSAEIEQYETYDSLAVMFSQLFVWPGLLGMVCYASQMPKVAYICWIVSFIALPLMLVTGGRARELLKAAEKRYLAIMGVHDVD